MKIKHEEYTIVVQAPYARQRCQYSIDMPGACKNDGSLAIKVISDRNEILGQYANLCPAHFLMVIIDAIR